VPSGVLPGEAFHGKAAQAVGVLEDGFGTPAAAQHHDLGERNATVDEVVHRLFGAYRQIVFVGVAETGQLPS
jgi:hypothetical protein